MGPYKQAWVLQPFLDIVLMDLFQHISNTEDAGKSVPLGVCDTHRSVSQCAFPTELMKIFQEHKRSPSGSGWDGELFVHLLNVRA